MPKLLGLVLPVLLALFSVQLMAEALYFRAIGYRPADSLPGAAVPRGPVHEVDRDASAGAMFT
jgi:hypothetical protein